MGAHPCKRLQSRVHHSVGRSGFEKTEHKCSQQQQQQQQQLPYLSTVAPSSAAEVSSPPSGVSSGTMLSKCNAQERMQQWQLIMAGGVTIHHRRCHDTTQNASTTASNDTHQQ